MRPLKIGLFTDVFLPDPNGVSTSVLLLMRELRECGHQVWVITPSTRERAPEPAGVVRMPSLPLPGVQRQRLSLPQRRRLPGSFDLIHTHTPWMVGWWGAKLARQMNVPHVSTFHTHLEAYAHYVPGLARIDRHTQAVARIARRFYAQADLIVAPSLESRCILEGYGVHRPARVLPSGIDARLLAAAPGISSPWPAGKRRLLTVSRLGREKRVDVLLRAFAALPERQTAHLVLVGEGAQEGELRELAATLGIADSVSFMGAVPYNQIGAYYRLAEVFCFASDTETQGLVLLEAQAMGLPVVAVGAGGTLGGVHHGASGALVPPNDHQALAGEIARLLADPALLQACREGALAFAAGSGAAHMAQRMLDTYGELLSVWPWRAETRREFSAGNTLTFDR